MTPCEAYLRTVLKIEKWLSISEFMKIALHDPKYGYYSQQQAIGAQNDFITAPEVSQLFGESLGLWILNSWEKLGSLSPFVVLELGPGRGTLLADLLRLISQRACLLHGMRLYLVEVNPYLKAQQESKLSSYNPRWFDSVSSALEASQELPIFVIANEFLDVFPIHQYILTPDGWRERGIQIGASEDLEFSLRESSLDTNYLLFPYNAKEGDIFETCPPAIEIINQVSDYITQYQGGALFIDYGYKEGGGDTLQALYQHRYVSPLEHLGKADLTAHVHFGALLTCLERFPSLDKNFSSQRDFLKQCGIEIWAQKLMQKASSQQREAMVQGLHRLVSPEQMGALFKVLEVHASC